MIKIYRGVAFFAVALEAVIKPFEVDANIGLNGRYAVINLDFPIVAIGGRGADIEVIESAPPAFLDVALEVRNVILESVIGTVLRDVPFGDCPILDD